MSINVKPHLDPKIMSPSKTQELPKYKIAPIPTDRIELEVIEAGVKVLRTLSTFDLEFTAFDWSLDRSKKIGKYLPLLASLRCICYLI